MRIMIIAMALLLLAACSSGPEALAPVDGAVSVPLAGLSDGKARHYDVSVDGEPVRFFVIQTTDGVARAAFDACDVCYHAKKGYTQQGEYMVCVNCGMRFHASRINEVSGGCNPAPLARSVRGDKLVISVEDLREGVKFF